MEATSDPALLLKVTPPRLRKALLVRERLRRIVAADDDVPVTLVEAPAGYGKTSLIAQWRLDWLQSGAAVGWMSLDEGDSPIALISGFGLGLRRGTGRPMFAAEAIHAANRGAGTSAALTALLAEIAEASSPMFLVLDNGERLVQSDTAEVVGYLLHNLPPNLRVVIGTRASRQFPLLDLIGHGLLRRLGAQEIGFDLTEAIELLHARSGLRIDSDLCAQLHEATGGWPLGLQLAAAALERSADPRRSIEKFVTTRDDGLQHLFGTLLDSLPPALGQFLMRCALLDALHPSLCEAVTQEEDSALMLQRLLVETPLLSAAEEGEWLRLHPLAREYLRSRAEQSLSEEDRRAVHVNAWHWHAAHAAPQRAAQHALAAGFRDEALDLVSKSLNDEYDLGHHGPVNEWLARLPASFLDDDPRLRMVELWMDVLGHRFEAAVHNANALIDAEGIDPDLRGEATVALAAAYAVADRQDDVRRYVAASEPIATSLRARHALAILKADSACDRGDTELARRLLAFIDGERATPAIHVWRDYFVARSFLLEGRPALAEEALRAPHAWWAAEVGRRGLRTATLGSMLAAACWQQDERSEARALLAHRYDVMEQATGYGGLIHACLTLSRMALADGYEARALCCLESLADVGERRRTVRLVVASLVERIRLHAVGNRPDQAARLLATLTALLRDTRSSEALSLQVQLDLELACTYVAFAIGDLAAVACHLDLARELAARLNRGYEAVQVLAMDALLAEQTGRPPHTSLAEALSRAQSGGLVRVFADTLPELVELVRRHGQTGPGSAVRADFVQRVLASAQTAAPTSEPARPLLRSAMLTPKEGQVLRLLAGGLHNKQIAIEMELSGDTVKWHMKKLFAKLNAGSRRHAVDRARMLGLLN